MSKDNVSQWSATAASNTDVGGITLAENVMLPSGVNNAFREMMAQIRSGVVVMTAPTTTVAGSFDLYEATNNGTNKITVAAPASIASDKTVTFQDITGTLYVSGGTDVAIADGGTGGSTAAAAVLNLGLAGFFLNYLSGLTLANNGSDATNDIDIAVGAATDGGNADVLVLASGLTKRLDAAWAVGTNQGGLDTGAIANGTYHLWLIKRPDTGVVDVLFSASASAPTMPANYTLKRRIGSIVRTGGAIKAFHQHGDDFFWDVIASDISATGPGTSAVTATLTLPTGIAIKAMLFAGLTDGTPGSFNRMLVSSLEQTDTAPSTSNLATAYSWDGGGAGATGDGYVEVFTNTSAQVRYRLAVSAGDITAYITTLGWVDGRGRA